MSQTKHLLLESSESCKVLTQDGARGTVEQ